MGFLASEFEKLLAGDPRVLAKAITLIESKADADIPKAHELLDKIMPFAGKAFKIGVTGTPGVGKSTFIDGLGVQLCKGKKKVAVILIDPSSSLSGGSVLADKTRMVELSRQPNSFVRPSPSGGSLGGVGDKTMESIYLCEAAGYDHILVETVGVGQSEFNVREMVDFVILLMSPNSGDEFQFIKKGILEIVDLILVNKCDGENREQALRTLHIIESSISVIQRPRDWQCPVLKGSSSQTEQYREIITSLSRFREVASKNGKMEELRHRQNRFLFDKISNELIQNFFHKEASFQRLRQKILKSIDDKDLSLFMGAREYVKEVLK